MKTFLVVLIIVLVVLALFNFPAFTQVETKVGAIKVAKLPPSDELSEQFDPEQELQEQDQELKDLESRVSSLEDSRDFSSREATSAGAVAFLFGAFCALWAQNTGRNAWLWFFLGLFFSVVTVLALLVKNAEDKAKGQL